MKFCPCDWTELQNLYQLQHDRQKEADVFVRAVFKEPEPENYIQKLKQATLEVLTDTPITLIYNMMSVADFSKAFAKINRPMLFAYEPALQPSADYLKAKLADEVRFERFDEDGHALFLDDPVTFNRMIDDFIQSLPKP